jgi:1-acyl-sn-glycerol-3-phosphate acyltransferase
MRFINSSDFKLLLIHLSLGFGYLKTTINHEILKMQTIKSFFVWLFILGILFLFFPLSFVIWLLLYPFDQERAVIHWWLVYEGCLLTKLTPIWKITVEGREKASRKTPYIIISNHQSVLDILILNCLRLRWKWISKIENTRVPVLGWYMWMAKYIYVDRGNKDSKAKMMEESVESLKKGISIMMFPEGSRSRDGEIAPFKLGAFQLALMTDKPILPVIVDGTGGVLPKHNLILSDGNILKLRVLDPVYPGSFGTGNPEELAAKFRNLMVEELKKMREGK